MTWQKYGFSLRRTEVFDKNYLTLWSFSKNNKI